MRVTFAVGTDRGQAARPRAGDDTAGSIGTSDGSKGGTADADGLPCSVLQPLEQTVPVVFASPHSGQTYPRAFIQSSRLAPMTLRRSEDAFVDRIFADAADFGAPLLRAHFPRAYVDPNREPFELDASMFDEPLPAYVNACSPRVASGLGTVPRVVANGEEIYRGKLSFGEVKQRIERLYVPYHATLAALLEATVQRFGCHLLIDCHSMPSIGGPMDADPGARRLDIVLGDCHGTSCAPTITRAAEAMLQAEGFTVRRNAPYAGGFTTRHYGDPDRHRHTLQVEINRALYMDELRIAPTRGLDELLPVFRRFVETMCGLDFAHLAGPRHSRHG